MLIGKWRERHLKCHKVDEYIYVTMSVSCHFILSQNWIIILIAPDQIHLIKVMLLKGVYSITILDYYLNSTRSDTPHKGHVTERSL